MITLCWSTIAPASRHSFPQSFLLLFEGQRWNSGYPDERGSSNWRGKLPTWKMIPHLFRKKAASWLLKITSTLCCFNLIFLWCRHWRWVFVMENVGSISQNKTKKRYTGFLYYKCPWHGQNKTPTGMNHLYGAGILKKKRALLVLTDCSTHSNFRQAVHRKTAKYKSHYTPCHHSFIDTWGIKKWHRCRDRGCNGTKMCQVNECDGIKRML